MRIATAGTERIATEVEEVAAPTPSMSKASSCGASCCSVA
jgi:hypothetical protein